LSHDHEFGDGTWSADLGGSHIVFGSGSLDRVGALALELSGVKAAPQRALVVTDPGIRAAGHVDRAVAALTASGLAVAVFDAVDENPSTVHVEHGTSVARAHGTDLLVGLGGGSSMDCCKGINFLLTQGGRMDDYWGEGKAKQPMLPSIGIPTTAGTGSEAQRFAIVTRPSDHRKMACGDRKARFRTVILDPDLLVTVPRRVAAITGIDAISHAVESHVCRAHTPLSQMYSREAFRRLERSFAGYLGDPGDDAARADMMLGAHLAGAAIETSMLGAAHSLANPLTARHDITHGVAVGLMLPHVVRFNAAAAADLYADLLGLPSSGTPTADAAELLASRLEDLMSLAGQPKDLASCGVEPVELPSLALLASEQWTAQFNPRRVGVEEFTALYASALGAASALSAVPS
jgi:alcohol dehydrogenase